MSTVVMMTSGKGGVGKSTATASLAMALCRLNKKVLCVDMDLGLRNLDVVLGLENRLLYDMKDIAAGRCTLDQALVQDKRIPNLYLLSACRNLNVDKLRQSDVHRIINQCREHFDVILLDCPAGIERGFQYAMSCADQAYLVVLLDITSLMDADRVAGILLRNGFDQIQLIVNRVNPVYIKNKIQCTIDEAQNYLSLPLGGIVYEDSECIRAMNYGHLSVPCSDLTKRCFDVIARRFLGQDTPMPKYIKKGWFKLLQHEF